jgi:hypothetical protein
MPQSYLPIRAHPAKPFRTVSDAAMDGQLLVQKCNLCRRTTHFLASDLIDIIDPKHPVHIPFFQCSRCATSEYINTSVHHPSPGDYGRLDVRRHGPRVQVQKWRTVKLGD